MLSKILLIYWLAISLFCFMLMFWDKQQALNNRWRVSERRFFILAAVGGSLGVLAAMPIFRHKNRKNRFKLPIYGMILGQVGACYLLNLLRII